MPDVSTATQEVLEAPVSMEGAAAELAVLQTKAQVAPELPSGFPAGTIAEVMKGVSTISEKIAKYGAELAEDNKKLTEATELLGGLATTFAKGAAVLSSISAAFAALGAVMGFLNSFIAPDPTAVILKAFRGLSEQMKRFQNFVEVELAEIEGEIRIQPKLQTISQTQTKLEAIQVHLNEYVKGEEVESASSELLQCEDPLELAWQIHNAWLANDGHNPNLLQLLYEKTCGEAPRLAPMIYQSIAFMMTALRAKTLRACIKHENDMGEPPDQHEVWRYAKTASDEIGPLVESLAREGSQILQQCEKEVDVNYKRKLNNLFPRISVRAADEATHFQAARTICNALKGYPQYHWNVLVHKDVDNGRWNWPVNWHDGTFDFFEPECKDGKACIAVVKSRPPGPARRFIKTLSEHEWPLPPSVLDNFRNKLIEGALFGGYRWPFPAANESNYEQAEIPKDWRDACFYRMDLRGWNDAVHKYASQVPGGKLLYLGIVKPELNPAYDTTVMGFAGMGSWCPLHVGHLGKGDDRKVPIKLFCVATA